MRLSLRKVPRPGAWVPQTRSSARQNTLPAISVPARARGPGLARAAVAGNVFWWLARRADFYRLLEPRLRRATPVRVSPSIAPAVSGGAAAGDRAPSDPIARKKGAAPPPPRR